MDNVPVLCVGFMQVVWQIGSSIGPWGIWSWPSQHRNKVWGRPLKFLTAELLFLQLLNLWDRVMHICISKLTIIGSDITLLPSQCQAIIWTNTGILLIGALGKNLNHYQYIFIQGNAFESVIWKMAAILSRPQYVKMHHCGYTIWLSFSSWYFQIS